MIQRADFAFAHAAQAGVRVGLAVVVGVAGVVVVDALAPLRIGD